MNNVFYIINYYYNRHKNLLTWKKNVTKIIQKNNLAIKK